MTTDRDLLLARDEAFLWMALEEADLGFAEDEVPIGAVIAVGEAVVARAHNRCEALADPTAHAECLAIREACAALGAGRLDGATLYCTIEPCAMCAGAILHARIDRVVFGAHDPKFGAVGSIVNLLDPRLRFNHAVAVAAGVLAEPCRDRMQRFFRARRGGASVSDSVSTPR
jgi:tRNA(Arg) A34 adenosine deaminase TadA